MSRHPAFDPPNPLTAFLNDFSDCFWCEPCGRHFAALQHPAEQSPPRDVRFRFKFLDDLHRLIPDEQHPSLTELVRFALSDGERVVLEVSTVDRGDLRDP